MIDILMFFLRLIVAIIKVLESLRLDIWGRMW